MRLAYFSPVPPAPTGIADYSAEVLALLASRHEIGVFHDQEEARLPGLEGRVEVHRAADFSARHAERPYDLSVYQLGNGRSHDFVWEPLGRWPGLLVLHDLALHHARGAFFLDSPEARAYAADVGNTTKRAAADAILDQYRAEVAWSYPGEAERIVRAQLGTEGRLLLYAYPLFQLPVAASRLVATHNECMARAVEEAVPGAEATVIPLLAKRVPVETEAVVALRARLGIAPDDVVVGSFGLLTPEKRVGSVVRALARALPFEPRLRLLLVGPVPDPAALEASIADAGIGGRTIVAGRVPFGELPIHIEASDVVAHLRWPTARETSAALLRVLAQGRATVVSDLDNQSELPAAAVVRIDVADEEGGVMRGLLRLAASPRLRERVGQAARDYVREAHSPSRCLAAYDAALARAVARRPPAHRPFPAHWPSPA